MVTIVTSYSSAQARLDAMHHLLQFPSGDLVTSDSWHTLSATVRHTLMDPDNTLTVSFALTAFHHSHCYTLESEGIFRAIGASQNQGLDHSQHPSFLS